MTLATPARAWWARFAVALTAFAAAVLWHAPTWRALAAPRPEITQIVEEQFDAGAASAGGALTYDTGLPSPNGWVVYQRSTGTAIYRPAPVQQGVLSRVAAWFYLPEWGTNLVEFSADGGATFTPLVRDTHFAGAGFQVPEALQHPGAAVAIRFTVTNPTANQFLALDKLALVYTDGAAPPLPARRDVVLAFVLLGLGIAILVRAWPAALLTVAILAAALAVRYDALLLASDRLLDPDALVYRLLALRFDLFSSDHGFYSANHNEREPVFVWLASLFFQVTEGSQFHLRWLTVVLSVALVWMTMRLATDVVGRAAAVAIGVLMALNVPLINESVRGLRLEAETIGWLLFLGVAFVWRVRPTWAPAVTGAVGGALLLLRSSYLPALVILAILAAWLREPTMTRRIRHAAIALGLMVALVVPHRVAMYHRRGDAFWDTKGYARWLANFEFVGQPGYPSRAELEVNGYIGPPISYGEYFFGLHTPRELATGTIRGYMKFVEKMRPVVEIGDRLPSPWLLRLLAGIHVLGILGLVLAAFDRRRWWLPVGFVLVLAPGAFLVSRGLLEDYRHSYQAFPLLLIAAALAVRAPLDWIQSRRRAHPRAGDTL